MSFASDTAVDAGRRALLHRRSSTRRWMSLVAIHGGYSAAIVARAIEAAVDDPDRALRTFATQFAAAPRPGTGRDRGDRRAHRPVDDHHERPPPPGRTGAAGRARDELAAPGPGSRTTTCVRPRGADPGDAPIFRPPSEIVHFQNAEVRLDPDVVPFGGGDESHCRGVAAPARRRGDRRGVARRDVRHPPARGVHPHDRTGEGREPRVRRAPRDRHAAAARRRARLPLVPLAARRARASRSRTQRCGAPTAPCSQSPARPASPAPEPLRSDSAVLARAVRWS